MDNKKICSGLEHLLGIVKVWGEEQPPQIEKDIVLEGIREVYKTLKCWESAAEACECVVEKEDLPEGCPSGQTAEIPCREERVAEPQITKEVPEAENEPVAVAGSLRNEAEDEAPLSAGAGQKADIDGFDKTAAKNKLDRRVILSLYGDDQEEFPVAGVADNDAVVEKKYTEDGGNDDIVPDGGNSHRTVEQKTVTESFADNKETQPVLGEVIGGNGKTLADAYAANNHSSDVASVISSGKVSDLRSSIGINDKFLMVRDLFEGDSDAYEAAVGELENFEDLDDALLHIHEKYNWNPNNEGLKLLVDLLTRKFS